MASPGPPEKVLDSPTTIFRDFDDEEVFDDATEHAGSINSKNFVVEFGPKKARIGFNLHPQEIKTLLESERDEKNYPIRWINIWDPSTQEPAVQAVGNHYEFSERLIRLMCLPTSSQPADTPRRRDRLGIPKLHFRRHADVELGEVSNTQDENNQKDDMGPIDDDSMELYLQVKNTVNYFSTDHTQKALCIGAHWLHKRPETNHESHPRSMMPPKHWQWLTLCNDHTVLSIHEKPPFDISPDKGTLDENDAEELRNIRGNTLDVLLQLSKCGFDLYKRKPLSLNSVRRPLSKWDDRERPNIDRRDTGTAFVTGDEPISLADEGTSNLFYYLFEDYVAAGPLKTAEKKLEQMTTKVLESARPHIRKKSIDIIPTLHYLSKDLRELKHLFENYKNLIGKITALGKPDAQAPNGHVENARRVKLTDTALSRFDRLGDRLQYLMLNSIEGYLGEISAVSSTYFNLTQQKDSEATARLTRSATLLAKLSVFFLPISFLTSYFSVQIEDLYIYWHGTDYWYAFAVIASVSFLSLFFFSRLLMFFSDTLDLWASHIMMSFRKLCRSVGLNIPDDDD
ncbi:putative adp-ribosylation factor protein [Rosellinia necatrix]|uniref:Putative adp-ribosylation factor protein n=1 Tax=Rosellinia necatrix TaxID=77044 RepID=A0A1W2TPX3_ROSNE|nr:putative adp-ribosylation factor protein [Rosellinia necatrix]